MKPEMKFVKRLEKNAQKGLKLECKVEKTTGIGKINFPMKRIPKYTARHKNI